MWWDNQSSKTHRINLGFYTKCINVTVTFENKKFKISKYIFNTDLVSNISSKQKWWSKKNQIRMCGSRYMTIFIFEERKKERRLNNRRGKSEVWVVFSIT